GGGGLVRGVTHSRGSRARAGRGRVGAERLVSAERDRRGEARALRLLERAGPAEAGLAPELRGGARVCGSAGALQRSGTGQGRGRAVRAGARRTALGARAPERADAVGDPAER